MVAGRCETLSHDERLPACFAGLTTSVMPFLTLLLALIRCGAVESPVTVGCRTAAPKPLVLACTTTDCVLLGIRSPGHPNDAMNGHSVLRAVGTLSAIVGGYLFFSLFRDKSIKHTYGMFTFSEQPRLSGRHREHSRVGCETGTAIILAKKSGEQTIMRPLVSAHAAYASRIADIGAALFCCLLRCSPFISGIRSDENKLDTAATSKSSRNLLCSVAHVTKCLTQRRRVHYARCSSE